MLVDRILILDLIALESKRENRYRHPHCIISLKSRGASKELYEENPCTDTELIEKSFDSNSWFVLFLCVLMLFSWMLISCYTFAFICCVCDFMVELKSEGKKELVSIVSLF
jgi:hypothetical protein